MTLIKGTNCGFVTTAPTSDPSGTGNTALDYEALALKVTSDASAAKVTAIGWWCDNNTEEANFEVAIYSHDAANDRPGNIIGSSTTNAKGTTSGWKNVTGLSITISPSTTYWIAVQLDDTTTTTSTDYQTATERKLIKATLTLLDPWGSGSTVYTSLGAIYAVWEAAPITPGIKVNIGDVFKDVTAVSINIGDTWKTVTKGEVNIGDVWKTFYGS
jgi:hypothetical protein